METKKKWSVEKITKLAVLIVVAAVAAAILVSVIFPNPIGANVRLITRMILAGTVVTAVFILGMWIYRAKKNKRMLKFFSFLLCILLVIVVVLNVFVSGFYVMLNQFLNRNTISPELVEKETAAAQAITEQIEAEGLVLLRNESNVLPLESKKVNLFGFASDAIIYGGSGSGAADESNNIDLKTAFENAGIEVNSELAEFYEKKNNEAKEGNGVTIALSNYAIKEPAVEEYEHGLLDNAKAFSDAAVVVFGRAGGEGADMPMDMAEHEGGKAGEHYMELAEAEKAMLDMVKENFDKVVVLINSSSPMELGFLEDEKIDAAMWIGGPGSVGLQAVASAVAGGVNPSGRLVDTYAYDATSAPAYLNVGDFSYTGTEHSEG